MLLGCIADDFTGATDLANNLVRGGMRVLQTIGVPAAAIAEDVDAVVVALKSRTIAAADAVAQSLAALQWLRGQGAAQIYFKVCSTFDSTDRGNIGPVAEALMQALGARIVPVCPAFPAALRTVFNGHLFVGDALLSDSGMRSHPLTPMADANLVRVLARQCAHAAVGLIDHRSVRAGTAAVQARLASLADEGVGLAIVDAIADEDLLAMGRAFAGLPLLVAGSGVAIALPQNHGIAPSAQAAALPPAAGLAAAVSGSCSVASNAQVRHFIAAGGAAFAVDPLAIAAGGDVVGAALAWAAPRLAAAADATAAATYAATNAATQAAAPAAPPLLVHATADAAAVRAVQAQLGVEAAGALVEQALSRIARGLVALGVRRLVVAGGETSGACVQALGIAQLRIGPQIDPGVPWCFAADAGLHIALKSGNFGGPDFFTKAFRVLA